MPSRRTHSRRTVLATGLALGATSLASGLLSAPTFAAASPSTMDPATEAALKTALAGPDRSAAHKARDQYRHPLETLKFFGLKADTTVMEVWPGGGWWTEFLAPVVIAHGGHYIAARADAVADPNGGEDAGAMALGQKNPERYGKIWFTPFPAGAQGIAPGSVDLALTFRNIHNWMSESRAKAMFDAMFTALKPGGLLGVEEHRASTAAPQDPGARSGYVRQDFATKLVKSAGFRLVAASEINANPKDTKDYPKGVWTLPPTYTEGDKDRAKYAAIGESDRFTLLFQKPV